MERDGEYKISVKINHSIGNNLSRIYINSNEGKRKEIAIKLLAIEEVLKNKVGFEKDTPRIKAKIIGDDVEVRFSHLAEIGKDPLGDYNQTIKDLSKYTVDSPEFKKLLHDSNMAKALLGGNSKQVNLDNDLHGLPQHPNLVVQRKPDSRVV